MRHRRFVLACITFTTGALAAPSLARFARAQKPGPAAPAPGGTLHLRRVEIMDPSGFEQPVPAASLLAPVDWRLEGGVTWGFPACMTDLVSARVRIASPDGRQAMEFFPLQAWNWSDDPLLVESMRQAQAQRQGCPAAPPMTAADALRQLYLPRYRPGARIVGAPQPDPAAAQAVREMLAPQANLRGPQTTLRTDAARLRLEQGGFEEWFAAAVSTTSYPAPSASAARQGSLGFTRLHDSATQSVYAFRAPAGGLEAAEPLFGTMLASLRLNPAWQAAVSQATLNIAQVRIQGAADRARIWRDAMNQIGEMRMQSWRTSQDSQDRIARAFSQYIRGVETRIHPGTGAPIEVPAGYGSAWVNGAGEIIVSNTPGFSPSGGYGGAWQALRPRG